MERENLAGDAKGRGTNGSNREAESTDAPERGGLPCSSDEAGKCRRTESELAGVLEDRGAVPVHVLDEMDSRGWSGSKQDQKATHELNTRR
jgi:hypothetical protein